MAKTKVNPIDQVKFGFANAKPSAPRSDGRAGGNFFATMSPEMVITPQQETVGSFLGLTKVNSLNDQRQINELAQKYGIESISSQSDLDLLQLKMAQGAPPAAAAPASAPADDTATRLSSQQAQIDAAMASNEAAAAAARGQYETQVGQLNSSITGLQGLLLKTKQESDMALANQQRSFSDYMLKSDLNLAQMQASYAMQARAATAIAPAPEAGAVAPVLGDARIGGRNAAANTLSTLRIIAPGLLDQQKQSVTLGGF